MGSSYFYLETFEDGLVNTLGLSVYGGIAIMGEYVDSIDGDDGVIDGNGSATGHSLWSNWTETVLTFNFDVDLLGALPTYAGLVWTDFGYNSPTPYFGLSRWKRSVDPGSRWVPPGRSFSATAWTWARLRKTGSSAS